MWRLFLLFATALFSNEATMNPVKAPYGSWVSPISADQIVTDAVKLGGMKEVGGSIYFCELRPSEKGRIVIARFTEEGRFEDLLPLGYNARSTVHEYGGGSSLILPDAIYFSNFVDQQIYQRDKEGTIKPLTNEKDCRFADGCPFGNYLIYVMEEHGKKVENCLVAIDRKSGEVRRIAEGADFYSSPRVSPDGRHLAY
jgi:hypothetical protein